MLGKSDELFLIPRPSVRPSVRSYRSVGALAEDDLALCSRHYAGVYVTTSGMSCALSNPGKAFALGKNSRPYALIYPRLSAPRFIDSGPLSKASN